jgi:nicotinate-nucleotide pyrophosphorylase (carboxylating)
MRTAVGWRDERAPDKQLEASGNVRLDSARRVAETGVDWISIGAITKDLEATDYSLRVG